MQSQLSSWRLFPTPNNKQSAVLLTLYFLYLYGLVNLFMEN